MVAHHCGLLEKLASQVIGNQVPNLWSVAKRLALCISPCWQLRGLPDKST